MTVAPLTDEALKDLKVRGILKDYAAAPLPLSPCVKCMQNGRIFDWAPIFANRPDRFVNCDEKGDEDPASWMGRGPEGAATGTAADPPPANRRVAPTPAPFMDNILDGWNAPLESASSEPIVNPALAPPPLSAS
jgi:hypothetical protein